MSLFFRFSFSEHRVHNEYYFTVLIYLRYVLTCLQPNTTYTNDRIMHGIAFHFNGLHYVTLHGITLCGIYSSVMPLITMITLQYAALIELFYVALHRIALHCVAFLFILF